MQKSEVPRPTTKRRASHAKNSWSIDETVLALFLRSRRVTDAAILIILNERYTPKVRQLGAIRNKLQFLRISEEKAGRIDLTNDKYFTRPENVDNWIRSQRSDTHKRWSDLLTFTEHEHEVMGGALRRMYFNPEKTLSVPGPSQALDPSTGQVIARERQTFDLAPISPDDWQAWDPIVQRLFPTLGPLANQGGSAFTMQPTAGDASSHDLYQGFQGPYNPEREGNDGVENDHDDDYPSEYRFQRDENDNCWWDSDQEQEDA